MSTNDNGRRVKEHLLTVSAIFDNKDIFEEFFQVYFELKKPEWMNMFCTEGAWGKYEFQEVLAKLLNLSLLQGLVIGATGARFSLHTLIQD